MTLPSASDRRFEQLRSLTEISRALTYATGSEEVLALATSRAASLLTAERAVLMLSDGDGTLRVRATHGVGPEALADAPRQLDESLIHRLRVLLGAPQAESFVGVPLVTHGAVNGLLAVVRQEGEPMGEDDEWILSAIADQIAVALENSRLEEELHRQREARPLGTGPEVENEAQNRALATLSHDLRSPLNAIDSYAELMEMEILGPIADRQREALGRIRLSGRHLLAVLENVLEMSRIHAGVVRVHSATVRLGSVVDEALLLVRPGAVARDQHLTVHTDGGPEVNADPDRLRQALVNLLGNAVKYTPTGGTIDVVSEMTETDGVRWGSVSIRDTGPGIAADLLESIFSPYYRATGPDDLAPEGTGLGLTIARELVRKMGGDIDVTSELGRGARFTVRLPLAAS